MVRQLVRDGFLRQPLGPDGRFMSREDAHTRFDGHPDMKSYRKQNNLKLSSAIVRVKEVSPVFAGPNDPNYVRDKHIGYHYKQVCVCIFSVGHSLWFFCFLFFMTLILTVFA